MKKSKENVMPELDIILYIKTGDKGPWHLYTFASGSANTISTDLKRLNRQPDGYEYKLVKYVPRKDNA